MEDKDDPVEKLKAFMAEHSMNYAFAILDEDGDLRYDYSNWRVGKMLFADSLIDMAQEMIMDEAIAWNEIEGDDDDE
tara:strand:+ start:441 stop:671 length:231 start_codon:yes stop_codon:yes gene_type:complete